MSSWTDEDEDGGTHAPHLLLLHLWEGGGVLGVDAGYGHLCPTFQG